MANRDAGGRQRGRQEKSDGARVENRSERTPEVTSVPRPRREQRVRAGERKPARGREVVEGIPERHISTRASHVEGARGQTRDAKMGQGRTEMNR